MNKIAKRKQEAATLLDYHSRQTRIYLESALRHVKIDGDRSGVFVANSIIQELSSWIEARARYELYAMLERGDLFTIMAQSASNAGE